MSYPKKLLSPDGTSVFAKQAVHEAELLAKGYVAAPEEPAEELVTCAKCVELQAKVAELEAQLAEAQEPLTGENGETEQAPAKRGRRAKAEA